MVETATYALLGFLAATLLALISVPAISRRAFRLAEARARLLAPGSVAQARADLEIVRGRHAIEIALVERRSAEAQGALSIAQIELGRRASEILQKDLAVSRRDKEISTNLKEIDSQRGEIAVLSRELRERETVLSALEIGFHDLTQQRDHAANLLAGALSRIASHETRAEQNRATIASLETKIAALVLELSDLQRNSENEVIRAESKIDELESRAQASRASMKSLEVRFADIKALHASLRSEAEHRAGETTRLRARLSELEPQLSSSEKMREAFALEVRAVRRYAPRSAMLSCSGF